MDLDPLRIALRTAFSFMFLLVLVRVSGKRTIYQGTAFDFVLALVLGDMIDNAIWGEVTLAQFMVAGGTLVAAKLGLTRLTRTTRA